MPDTFTVENEPIPVDASPEGGKTIHNLHGGTIHYRNTAESVETGEALDPGDSVTTSQRLWLIADDSYEPAAVLVENAEVGKPISTVGGAVKTFPKPGNAVDSLGRKRKQRRPRKRKRTDEKDAA